MISKDPEIRDALRSCTQHFFFAGVYGLITSLLLLSFPLYMLNVYGRVLTSRSLATLAVLLTGFIIAITFKGVFNWLRSALMVRASVRLDRILTERVLQCLFERRASGRSDIGTQALRDLDQFRPFRTQAEHCPFGYVQHRLLAAIGNLTAEGALLDRFDELGGAAVAPDA